MRPARDRLALDAGRPGSYPQSGMDDPEVTMPTATVSPAPTRCCCPLPLSLPLPPAAAAAAVVGVKSLEPPPWRRNRPRHRYLRVG